MMADVNTIAQGVAMMGVGEDAVQSALQVAILIAMGHVKEIAILLALAFAQNSARCHVEKIVTRVV